jgi:hypothetical protein
LLDWSAQSLAIRTTRSHCHQNVTCKSKLLIELN